MAKVNSKREITTPARQCDETAIKPDDEVEGKIVDGWLVVKKKDRNNKEITLEQALEGFPVDLNEEDKDWLDDEPVGKEIL